MFLAPKNTNISGNGNIGGEEALEMGICVICNGNKSGFDRNRTCIKSLGNFYSIH